ncbi:MAG: MerR family transcriptional regulator [Bryobacteraceae bacterium]
MKKPAPVTTESQIPNKLFFRIGEAAALIGVEPYVLRYWETEFPALVPKKSGTGQRMYRRKEVELLLRIKHLLYEKRFTIEGARQHLEDGKKAPEKRHSNQRELFAGDPLPQIRRELEEILAILK